jgi:hypothetical protein
VSNPKWQKGPVKLANGSEAEITRINEGQEDFCYVGHVMIGATWHPAGWHASGRMMYHKDTGNNLAPPPKKTVRVQESWLVIFPRGHAYIFFSEQSAKNEAYEKRAFAIRKIEPFEVTEGEGL